MSFSLSSLNPVGSYLSIIKDESRDVAAYVQANPGIQRNAAAFDADIVDIKSPTDILANNNYAALQVALGAYTMTAENGETGLLRALLTQDPTASSSVVQQTGSTNYLHFVRALSNLGTISLNFGVGEAQGFTASGAGASTLSVRSVAWSNANSSLSPSLPAQSWTYVLNNGSAAQSVANALTAAWQSAGTSSAPVQGSYGLDANGNIVASGGAPALTSKSDSAGNTTYTLTLAKNASGAAIRTASVISVNTAGGSTGTPPSQVSATQGTSLLAAALTSTGFNVTSSGTGLTITNPSSNTALSLATNSYSNFAATTPQAISTYSRVLFLGSAGTALQAGQTLMNKGQVIGTVQSVNSAGDVTLAANAAVNLAAGSEIDVAIGAGVSNVGVQLTAPHAGSTASDTLALGASGAAVSPGQTITDGNKVIGIVKSVDGSGNVTFTANLAAAVSAGDTLSVLPQVTTASLPGLSAASNAQTVLSQYETNAYETAQGKQVTGLDTALYFTRVMPTITSINQLMSDPTLLKVVTNNLGVADSFNNLDFDQQVALLTAKIKLPDDTKPAAVQQAAEQYLVQTNEQAMETAANNSISDMFGDNPNDNGDGPDLLSTIYPGDSSTDGSSVLTLFSGLDDSSSSTGSVSLSI